MQRFILLWHILIAVCLYTGAVMMNESRLRKLYDEEVSRIPIEAEGMIAQGTSLEGATRWAVDQRNYLKEKIRNMGNSVSKRSAELRNLEKYGDIIGPTYESLLQGLRLGNESNEIVNRKILKGSGNANAAINAKSDTGFWVGLLLFLVALATTAAWLFSQWRAKEMPKWALILREALRGGGALLGGYAGTEIGVFFSQQLKMDAYFLSFGVVFGLAGCVCLAWLFQMQVKQLVKLGQA